MTTEQDAPTSQEYAVEAILDTITDLKRHTDTLAAARKELWRATQETGAAEAALAAYEQRTRNALILAGLEGRNEAERRAHLETALAADAGLAGQTRVVALARRDRDQAEARYDVAYREQQAARAILAALTALVGGQEVAR